MNMNKLALSLFVSAISIHAQTMNVHTATGTESYALAGIDSITFDIVPTDGLIAYYAFSGNANDNSGNAANGTVHGATLTEDRFGNTNSAYSFDGTDDYIDIPNISGNQNYTQSVWVKWQGSQLNGMVLATDDGHIWQNDISTDSTIICYSVHGRAGITGNSTSTEQAANVDLPYDTWVHIAVVAQGDDSLIVYKNGVRVTTSHHTDHPSGTYMGSFIGKRSDDVGFFKGILDDIRVYNRALSDAEISALAN